VFPIFSPFVQAFQALLNSFYPDGCVSSKGQRWFPVNSLSQLLSAPQEQKHLQVSELQKSDLLLDLKFSRSVLHFTPEEPSPWASLLAGGISLGPVDAPCSGETSTAQGDLLLGATAKQSETSKSSCLPAVTSDQTHTKLLMHRVLPMSPCSRQNFQPSPASRLGLSLLIAKDRLGFPLVDPQSVFGPLRPQLIKPNKCASIPNPLKPRYDLISKLSKLKPSRRCDQDYDAYGFHRRSNSLLLLWRNFHLLKTLVEVFLKALIYEPYCLSLSGIWFPIPIRPSIVYGYGLSTRSHVSAKLVKHLKHQSISIPARTLVKALHSVALLMPARITALPLYSTLLRHVITTVAISSPIMEEVSTILDLT
ncbi:PREDICTED: uncharacterized protein LOC104772316, partial [Camelina sativa]|uniref:Uncharacterized protein LOC104772316 n=1 Tax=Camelina sativa TaxID=90675 RepID=A0ABM1RFR8_CAMSA